MAELPLTENAESELSNREITDFQTLRESLGRCTVKGLAYSCLDSPFILNYSKFLRLEIAGVSH